MGGRVFTTGLNPLHTPRMPPAVYARAKEICHQALGKVFESVASPIEAPGKQDYGDIDILLHGRRELAPGSVASSILKALDDDPPLAVRQLLGAERMKLAGAYPSYAIPWPKPLSGGHKDSDKANDETPCFIQVDVQICKDLQTFQWSLFHEDHGDVCCYAPCPKVGRWYQEYMLTGEKRFLRSILGATVRPYGLTITDGGLYVRIPEVEKENQKKSRILLTREPSEALEFLGLDYGAWKQPFATMDEAYEYVATSRFFWVWPDTTSSEANETEGPRDIGAEFKKQELKSNDRQRMTKRPMFRCFVEEFMPRCRREGRFAKQRITREQTLIEAFERFDVRPEYEKRLLEHRKQRQIETLWRTVIKAALPEEGIDYQRRGVTASALKKIIMQDDESFGILPATSLKDSNGLYLEDEVRRFVQLRWEEVGEAALRQSNIQYRNSKASKKRAGATGGTESITGDEAVKLTAVDKSPEKKAKRSTEVVDIDGIDGKGSIATNGHAEAG